MKALERAAQLTLRLELLAEAQRDQNKIAGLEPIAGRLEETATDIAELFTIVHLLSQREIRPDCPSTMVADVRKYFKKVKEVADKDPFNLSRGQAYGKLLSSSSELCRYVKRSALTEWQGYVQQLDVALDEQLLTVVGGLNMNSTELRQYKLLRKELEEFRAKLPESDKDIEEVSRITKGLHAIVGKLPWTDLDPEVVQFLREAQGAGGASVIKLSPAVKEWCEANGIWARLRIRLS